MRSKYLLNYIILFSVVILLLSSSIKHELFQSTAADLGIFDQAVYLISIGENPISSYMGFHILADHAAFILYPLALLYKIYPHLYWLFLVQSLSLSMGALVVWYLSIQAELSKKKALLFSIVYLLYPVLFNINLFDFHPEVVAIPFILLSILATRLNRLWLFCSSLIVVATCKEVLSFTIIAMGVGFFFERRKLYGAIAISFGIAWFLFTTKWVIPFFGNQSSAIERQLGKYSYLGGSFQKALINVVHNPTLILEQVFSLDNVFYLVLLLVPVLWGLSLNSLKYLTGAIPTLLLNILSNYAPQKDLIHQYSLPILPFIILALISTKTHWIKNNKLILIWAVISFISLSKFTYFGGKYLNHINSLEATRVTINQVEKDASVYTTAEIAPHLSHRKMIQDINPTINYKNFTYIILNVNQKAKNFKYINKLFNQLKTDNQYSLNYSRDGIYLFKEIN